MPLERVFRFPRHGPENIGKTDERMSVGKISIQRQRLLIFANALIRSLRKHLHAAQDQMGQSVVRGEGKSFDRGRLGCRKPRGPVVRH
jgi:hypothetical protein